MTRTASNRRRCTERQRLAFPRMAPSVTRRIVAYGRVSSAAQCPVLANQRVPEQCTAARGLAGVEYIEECWRRTEAGIQRQS
jgi:hypothetical protein